MSSRQRWRFHHQITPDGNWWPGLKFYLNIPGAPGVIKQTFLNTSFVKKELGCTFTTPLPNGRKFLTSPEWVLVFSYINKITLEKLWQPPVWDFAQPPVCQYHLLYKLDPHHLQIMHVKRSLRTKEVWVGDATLLKRDSIASLFQWIFQRCFLTEYLQAAASESYFSCAFQFILTKQKFPNPQTDKTESFNPLMLGGNKKVTPT